MSACSGLATRVDDAPAVEPGEDLAALVRFGTYVHTLDEEELERQYTELLTQYDASPSRDTAIKLSLLLSRRDSQPPTLAQALRLLAAAANGDDEDADFGRMLYHLVSERYVAAAGSSSLSALLVEATERSARLDEELAKMRETLKATEKQRVALAHQLDALKTIEARFSDDQGGGAE